MSLFCSLCNLVVPEQDRDTHRTGVTHLENFRNLNHPPRQNFSDDQPMEDEHNGWDSLPYIEETTWGYKCLWCDRLMQSVDQMEMHLRGKDHTRRCVNTGIVPYGHPDHESQATEYVRLYGHDPYARLAHWPECIEESGLFWTCRICKDGKKKFQTQRDVNDHLNDPTHLQRMRGDYPSSGSCTPSPNWPACIVQDGLFWKCCLCNVKFNAPQTVEMHLVHPRHVKRTARTGAVDSSYDSNEGCYLCMDFFDPTLDDDHSSCLKHICAMYCTTVDGFA